MSTDRTSIEYPPEQYPFRIKGWDKFQYYKFRRPPWVRLHVSTLQSGDWVMLDDQGKLLMLSLMMLASQFDGHLPVIVTNTDYLKRVLHIYHRPNLKPLISSGFLIETHASACEDMQSHASASQSTETEYREDKKDISVHPRKSAAPPEYSPEFLSLWAAYPKRDGSNPKHLAYKAYREAIKKGADPAVVVAGASRLAESFAGKPNTERRFIPQAATWLNQRRWEDEVVTSPVRQGYSV